MGFPVGENAEIPMSGISDKARTGCKKKSGKNLSLIETNKNQ
jgi:hypothetical protein